MIGWRTASRPAARRRGEREMTIMTRKTKGHAGGHQVIPKTTCKRDSAGTVARVKAAIVTLALRGWLSLGLAAQTNPMGGPSDE